jgi:hypothetical protein
MSVEIFEDGTSVTKTVRSSQIGGAVVGGLILGGVGAIIGGLSGKAETTRKVNRIDLRIIVNDTTHPLHDVVFLNVETKNDTLRYQQAMQQARHWNGVIEVLINRANAEDKQTTIDDVKQKQFIPPISAADEIKKLSDLYTTGTLTLDEFKQLKQKLLNSN